MNKPDVSSVLRDLLRLLVTLRVERYPDDVIFGIRIGRCCGVVAALREVGLISGDEAIRLESLVTSVYECAGDPFPSRLNGGPVMPVSVRLERERADREATANTPAVQPVEVSPMNLNKYLHQPHRPDCDCSVCWSKRELAKRARSQSTPCTQCRRATVSTVNGRTVVTPASYCEKHTPSQRPPKWWHVVSDSGKPTPFVPIHEPFDMEG